MWNYPGCLIYGLTLQEHGWLKAKRKETKGHQALRRKRIAVDPKEEGDAELPAYISSFYFLHGAW